VVDIYQTIFLIAAFLGAIILIGSTLMMINTIGIFLGTIGPLIIGPLIGALVGVYWGFKVNDKRRMELEDQKKSFFQNLLMHEVLNSIDLLESGGIYLIPVDMWNSIVNSGNIALLNGNAIELSDLYFEMRNYNYEAKRIRDATEEYNLHPDSTRDAHIGRLKAVFNAETKPSLLKNLKNYRDRIITLKIKPANFEVKVNSANLIHTDKDGNIMDDK
jgi:hypothetical protein